MEGFQLWLNLPAKDKMRAPWYRDIQSAEIPQFTTPDGVTVRVIAGAQPRRGGRGAARSAPSRCTSTCTSSRARASSSRCPPRTTPSSTSTAARLRSAARACRRSAWRSWPTRRRATACVLHAGPRASARAADRRPAAERADRAVRPVRDEHAAGDLPGGRGLPRRPLLVDALPEIEQHASPGVRVGQAQRPVYALEIEIRVADDRGEPDRRQERIRLGIAGADRMLESMPRCCAICSAPWRLSTPSCVTKRVRSVCWYAMRPVFGRIVEQEYEAHLGRHQAIAQRAQRGR